MFKLSRCAPLYMEGAEFIICILVFALVLSSVMPWDPPAREL